MGYMLGRIGGPSVWASPISNGRDKPPPPAGPEPVLPIDRRGRAVTSRNGLGAGRAPRFGWEGGKISAFQVPLAGVDFG